MSASRAQDAKWRDARTWSLVYHAGDELTRLLTDAYTMFFSENGLNPMAFPSLKRFESEVVSMTAGLLGGDDQVVGNMTSGGSESLLMAVKTARDLARVERPDVDEPEMVLPDSAHPALLKAAHYFGVKPVRVPVRADFRADVEAMARAITPDTILLVGSAPSYPHGVIDPIADIGLLAAERGLSFHVDSCLGGFLLPFARRLGHAIPDFDLRVPGVTSISADVHKYGFAAKGASVILYRNSRIRRHQYFTFADWSGGLYASPTMTGTRPGGAIAAAWAVLNYLGEEGYLRLTETTMRTTEALMKGINAIDGLRVLGDPDMSVFAFASDSLDVYVVADLMDARGWHLDRQQMPSSLHLMVTPAHAGIVEAFLGDLRAVVQEVRSAPEGSLGGGMAAIYGGIAKMPDRTFVHDFLAGVLDEWTRV
jgi:glutamate/tyrosine decarboxylase-like PLP-dependent enzyme